MTFGAAAVQGLAGFGFVLLALSFYLLLVGPREAIQILVVLSLFISVALAVRSWRSAPRDLLGWLLVGALAGFPMGLMGFVAAGLEQLRVGVAAIVVIFATLLTFQRSPNDGSDGVPRFRTRSALATGLLAGAMTSSVGMAGPPLVLYLTALGLTKDAVRATAFCFFAGSYAITLALMMATVGIRSDVWWLALILVPAAVLGAALGHRAAPHVPERSFRGIVLALVAAASGYALYTTFAS